MYKNVIFLLLVSVCISCSEDRCNPDKLVSVNIDEITIKSFPNVKSDGEVWDTSFLDTEYPADLVISVSNTDSVIWNSQIYKPNVTAPSDETFDCDLSISEVDRVMLITIWDMDDIENEFVGSISFIPREMYSDADCMLASTYTENGVEVEMLVTFRESE